MAQTETRTAELVEVLYPARRVDGVAGEFLCLYCGKVCELVHGDAQVVESAKSVVNGERGATGMVGIFCAGSGE